MKLRVEWQIIHDAAHGGSDADPDLFSLDLMDFKTCIYKRLVCGSYGELSGQGDMVSVFQLRAYGSFGNFKNRISYTMGAREP